MTQKTGEGSAVLKVLVLIGAAGVFIGLLGNVPLLVLPAALVTMFSAIGVQVTRRRAGAFRRAESAVRHEES
ncbi:hypothetical protein [Streptomyces sp. NPDC005374]|uniref:hypothetical protein n=1 Tax=Streptomyces sp. NPDC005374 TaxID=3364713 RepID=UPI003690A4E6